MCTYDYTPYTGCGGGEQHYYIQWVKCTKAAENGRYCSLESSTEVELGKLSSNVLSCPLHGPIAVQQYVLEPANAARLDEDAGRRRARSTARTRNASSRSRTPGRAASSRDFDQPARKQIRGRTPRREIAPESSDSESSSSPVARHRASRLRDREPTERRRSRPAQGNHHRRSVSADVALPPPTPPTLPSRYGRSHVSLPLNPDLEAQAEESQASNAESQQSRPKTTLNIPLSSGVVGLPSSPDMHRRASVHRSRSEGMLRPGEAAQVEPIQPVSRTMSPSSDSSPDHNGELPFSTPVRRGRRAGVRSNRERSVDTTMRRIDEHVVPEENDQITREASATRPSESGHSATTSPEPLHQGTDAPRPLTVATAPRITHHRRQDSRPRLDSLQIPMQRDHYQRDAYSAPTATPPETDINMGIPLRGRTKSLRQVDLPLTVLNPPSQRNEETASIRSTRSRRLEDQITEGRKWAAAREHMPALSGIRGPMADVPAHMFTPNLALGAASSSAVPLPLAGRESVDSGYRSGHQPQRSWETIKSAESGDGGSGTGRAAAGKGGRNTLQKAPPPQLQLQQQGQGAQQQPRPVPEPLQLNRLPPCALPVSLMSPSFQPDADASSVGRGGKRQRMGLRKKISGLLWDRGGQRELGAVEG
ncbi:hypothetical protein C8A03DRAFT_36326 [Achaetomium macrosporum]|uniref:Uncharacterized protein n=1 Tax=Achaetomium macrosporum TaxID=79813 RepID=A0AAN7C5X8_9PEZI|nr:hypothetical protein C8A03DRAFT_36326 [Achaetomium macrosporum]